MFKAVKVFYSKYADFSGRATRSEYWYVMLFFFLVGVAAAILGALLGRDAMSAVRVLLGLFSLASLVPNIALSVRRLHDIDKSGAWWFIRFVPFVGGIVLFVFSLMAGTYGPNQYGNPNDDWSYYA